MASFKTSIFSCNCRISSSLLFSTARRITPVSTIALSSFRSCEFCWFRMIPYIIGSIRLSENPLQTKVPSARLISRTPIYTRILIASLMELRATPSCSDNSISVGILSPGLSSPLSIASVSRSITRCTTDDLLIFFKYSGISLTPSLSVWSNIGCSFFYYILYFIRKATVISDKIRDINIVRRIMQYTIDKQKLIIYNNIT